jgi:hypothetical protein
MDPGGLFSFQGENLETAHSGNILVPAFSVSYSEAVLAET